MMILIIFMSISLLFNPMKAKAADDVIVIKTAAQLNAFAESVNSGNTYDGKIVTLGANIKYDGVTINNFTPIGNEKNRFCGEFDGKGYTISGIVVVGIEYAGLFGAIEGATIRNVVLENCEFSGYEYVGGICAYVEDAFILNCANKNGIVEFMSGKYGAIGGIVGCDADRYSIIANCSMSGKIVATSLEHGERVGGIAGAASEIYNCCNKASITLDFYSTSWNEIDGGYDIGGVAGTADFIQNCYNIGNIKSKCFTDEYEFSGSLYVGGIAGYVLETVRNSYCSKESYSKMVGKGDNRNCVAYPLAKMKTEEFRTLLNKLCASNENWYKWEFNKKESAYPQLEKTIRLNQCKITVSGTNFAYTGKAIKPKVTITYNGKTLKNGTDYVVFYSDNKYIGKGTITIWGCRNLLERTTKKMNIYAKKGTSFTVSGGKYTITSGTTVTFTAISNKSATSVTIPKTVSIGKKNFKVTAISKTAFKGNTKLKTVVIGSGITTISASMFEGCSKLTKVTLGSNVTSIGSKAFKGCKALTSVTIPSKVKTIGTSAFEGCSKLAKVTLGSAVTSIGSKAFKSCKVLKNITVPANVKTIGAEAFYGCSKLENITIKGSKITSVGKNALKGIKSTAKITVPSKKYKTYKSLLSKKGQSTKVKIVKK